MVPRDRLIDFIVPLALSKVLSSLPTGNQRLIIYGGTVIMLSPVMDFDSMPTEAHVLGALVTSALGHYLSHGDCGAMYVMGNGSLNELEHTP